MDALHDLVRMGKVHYLGASSMYCWQLARLQYTVKMNNWMTFTSMQGLWNLLYRKKEQEVNLFCRAEGIGLIPWSPLARGYWLGRGTRRRIGLIRGQSGHSPDVNSQGTGLLHPLRGQQLFGKNSAEYARLLDCEVHNMEDVERLARTNAPWVKALGADAVLKRRGYAVALINVDVDVIGRSNPLKRQRELAKRLLAANTHRWAATPTDITYVGWARPWKRVVQEGRPH
ncbi:hypothetical protein AtubIFM55763_002058, partial [Aspergillus tubingensis]